MKKIGITTTIPIEIIYAAGKIAVDLNNLFINHPQKTDLVMQAEIDGLPRNFCAWVKGIYSVAIQKKIKEIIIVTEGDCSSTVALSDILKSKGIKIIPFSFPYDSDKFGLKASIDKLIRYFGTSWETVEKTKQDLDRIRKNVHLIDQLTWKEDKVSGFENHFYNICASDFNGSPHQFEKETRQFIQTVKKRKNLDSRLRLGYFGIPPIVDNLYDFFEICGARVVFNEVQRQFSMPDKTDNIIDQYLKYTYPYGVSKRVQDINKESSLRKIDGLIHYSQSFCHHQAEHMLYKEWIGIPILLLECDYPGELDARSKMRIESFISMLKHRKYHGQRK